MSQWIVPGHEESSESDEHLRAGVFDDLVGVEPVQSVRVDVSRESGETVKLSGVAADEVLEIELEDGLKQWVRVDQFEADFEAQLRRDRDSDALLIPTHLAFGPRSRSGGWAVKAIRRLKVGLGRRLLGRIDAPGMAASALSGVLEKRFMPEPGFFRWDESARLVEAKKSEISTEKAVLVFLHGTFSSTKGSFGDLTGDGAAERWKELHETYDGQIYALDHHTLVESPIDNAVAVMSRLPEGARLHLVSHSRGGLIGELLCRSQRQDGSPFDEDDLRVIQGDFDDEDEMEGRAGQYQALADLDHLLRSKQPRVERFLRVACPGGGTSLAGRRLDRWLSMLVNVMKLVPALAASPVFDFVSAFTLAVVKERMNPRRFPGLEALVPDSPLIKVLNRPDVTTAADLTVIAGDLEGIGVWGTLKSWISDLYYREDHDLVVNTSSMYGGMRRTSGGLYFFDRGNKVDHFRYFANEKSVRKIREKLQTDEEDQPQPAGFLSLEEKRQRLEKKRERMEKTLSRQRDDGKRPVVFLLPGIMGSHLWADGDRVWLGFDEIAKGKLARLGVDELGVSPDGLMASAYADILDYLAATHKVVPFAYDWRRSLLDEAQRLADVVASELDAQKDQPVRILAHSMGGILARAMIAKRPEVWKELTRREGGRLVMLGTPNGGSFVIPRVLLGRAKILRLLALLDFRHSRRGVLDIVSRFTGLLELLPKDGGHDFYATQIWDELEGVHGKGWVKPEKDRLEKASRIWKLLGEQALDREHVVYVAGQAPSTPVGLEIDKTRRGKRGIRFLATSRGDGSVPWESGIPPHVPTWYMNVEHGRLAAHENAFPALEELLASGTTSLLSSSPPVARGDDEPFELPDDEVDLYPEELDLESAALGFSSVAREEKASEPIRVFVSHDHLAFARFPVAVGHHDGDAILGAEAALDYLLEGRLTKRRELGQYPGPVGSSGVVLVRSDDPQKDRKKGAIVIGLGNIGELLPSHLEDSFTHGALRYALLMAKEGGDPPPTPRAAPITSLVIGSGFGGLSTGDSIRAILSAVLRANNSLAKAQLSAWVRIDELQMLEIYRDQALEAALALREIVQEPSFRRHIEVEPYIRTGSAGRTRVLVGEASEWWHRLRIAKRSESDPSLSFTVLTERARAEVNLLPDQRSHVEHFVRRAVSSTRWNDLLANTLFHLLMPNELKHFANDRRNLVLVLDREAAGYPWELLHDRSLGDTSPFATRSGLIRQLVTERFRREVEEGIADTALVVGDPPSHLIELPGAEQEAREVTDRLKGGGFRVNDQIRTSAEAIDTALFAEDYQVIHLAGHGVFDEEVSSNGTKSRATGLVIGENLILTPAQVNQMPRIPELVFLNCCHLGRQDVESKPRDDYHLIAANLATQFIEMGVRAVVTAGWAVDDAAARTFALEFYDQMLRGQVFGHAVREARLATFEEHRNVNTWGAYQCYGDPSYKLRRRRGSSSGRSEPDPVSPDHAGTLFSDIAQRAQVQKKAHDIEELKKRLDRVSNKVPKEWWAESAALSEAAGDAYAELGMFREAVASYECAACAEKAEVSLRAIEQAANLRVRHAEQLAESGVKEPDPKEMIRRSIDELNHLVEISSTAERHSLLGSAYKRLMTVEGRFTKKNLAGMAEAYEKAYRIKKKRGDLDDAYPLTNWLTASLAGDPLAASEVDELLDDAVANLKKKLESAPDFWTRVMVPDCEVVRHLHKEDLSEHCKPLLEEYAEILRTTGSARKINSVRQQFNFQFRVLQTAKRPKKERGALRFILNELKGFATRS